MPVEQTLFKNILPCKKPNQIGCICSWRTFKDGYKPKYILYEKDSVIVSNPLTWDAEKPIATVFDNKGSMLKYFNKLLPAIVSAKIEHGILGTMKPKFFDNIFLTTKNYHIADYNFFWLSIRENVALRIKDFTNKFNY